MKKFAAAVIVVFAPLGLLMRTAHAGYDDQLQPLVEVINHEWYRTPVPLSSAQILFEASTETINETLERYGTLWLTAWRPDSYSQGLCPHVTGAEEKEVSPRGDEYTYKVRIHNAGQKKIKSILWDYVFIDPKTGKVLARHAFHSESQLSPGKTKTLFASSVSPPTRVVTVGMLSSKEGETYHEQVEIKHVEYADGSVWERN